ncbi:MAG: ribosome silencing factor [bacterium]
MIKSLELMRRVREALVSKKAANIVVFDVRNTSPVTDYYMVASGATAAQLKAMASVVTQELKTIGLPRFRCSGVPDDGWMVLDLFDVVIHIFQTEIREYYSIEELWADSPRVE